MKSSWVLGTVLHIVPKNTIKYDALFFGETGADKLPPSYRADLIRNNLFTRLLALQGASVLLITFHHPHS